ncbi:MAG: protein kinase domain-containing protein, partial [Bryobacteraceae bacterium]
IVHRDLKPENVMVRPDGYIKVVDFGLARNISLSGSGGVTSTAGLPVGTIRYMSPEQCRGETATPASDVFALGITLYETCTGQHPFEADSPLEVAHSIVWEDPLPAAVVKPAVPPALSALIQQMLAKDPSGRLSSADIAQKLTTVGETPRQQRRQERRWYAAAVATAVVAGLAAWILSSKEAHSEPPLQLLHSFPLTSQHGYETYPAISADGTAVAFTWSERVGPPDQIWVKRLAEPSAVRVGSTTGGIVGSPTWSADGRRIFFKRSDPTGLGGIMSVASTGGKESRVADLLVGDPSSALDASPDGRWLAFTDKPGPNSAFAVMILNLETGERRQFTHPPDGYWGDWDPKFSPDGRVLAFKRVKGLWQDSLHVAPVTGGAPRQLTFDGQGIAGHAWFQSGKSLLVSCQRGGTIYALWRVPLEPGGQPVLINEGGADLIAPATARRANTVAWVNQVSDENIYRVAASGDSAPVLLITSTRRDTKPSWAPDGRIAFVSDRAGSLEVWLAQPDGSAQTRVTDFRRGPTGTPDWSADGRRLLINAYSDGRVVTLDCAPPGLTCGKPRLIPRVMPAESEPTWSGNGDFIYFSVNNAVWREPAAGGQPIRITRQGGLLQRESRDGRWLYYAKSLSGVWRTRLPVPGTGADEEEKMIHLPAEYVPVWALGTKELFFFKNKSASEAAGIFACNIATRRIRRITSTSEVQSITVSQDQQQLLYSRLDYSGSNVLVARADENSPP